MNDNKCLLGKKILLLTPFFYGYEKEIRRKLEEMGGCVTYINDDPSELYSTAIFSFEKLGVSRQRWIRIFEDFIYRRIVNLRFDYVLVISGWAITSNLTTKIRRNNLNYGGKMVLYYWDSLKRLNDDRTRWDSFDRVYTFDREDYINNKDLLHFLPLFYCDKYWRRPSEDMTADVMAIGSFRLNRLEFIRKIQSLNPHLTIDKYLFSTRWVIILHKTLRKKYRNVNLSDIRYKKLSSQEVVDLYSKYRAVLDIPAIGQSGLAIRTFETMAMHKKLITSNPDVITYDFYDPNNIFVISDNNMSLPPAKWFHTPFSIPDNVIMRYSIGSWLTELFDYE